MRGITRFILAFVAIICLASCGGGNNKNSIIDESMASKKHWVPLDNSIGLLSENYYVSDKGENVYGALTFVMVANHQKASGLGFAVFGADKNQPKTTIRIDNRQSFFMVSFNNGKYIPWPFSAHTDEIARIGYYNEWENCIRESETCEITFVTEDAEEMVFRFNTKGFPW